MNYTQNQLISQIAEFTLIVDIDMAKHKHKMIADSCTGKIFLSQVHARNLKCSVTG
jgi:hypothetical protein